MENIKKCIEGDVQATMETYNRAFHDSTRFDHYDSDLFKERAACSLYAIGRTDEGVLGTIDDSKLDTEGVETPIRSYTRMASPFRVPIEGPISQIGVDRSIQALTSSGKLYLTREWTRIDSEKPPTELVYEFDSFEATTADKLDDVECEGHVTTISARREVEDTFKKGLSQGIDESQCPGVLERMFISPFEPTKFREIASFGNQFYAIDTDGLIWEWSRARHPRQGVPVLLAEAVEAPGDKTGICAKLLPLATSKIQVNDTYKTCFVEGVGIVRWWQRTNAAWWRNGYPCQFEHPCLSKVVVVPDTASGVVEYAVLGKFCVYLKEDGTVACVDMWIISEGEEAYHSMDEINALGKFVQISGNGVDKFALVTESGAFEVRIAEEDWGVPPTFEVVTKIKDLELASVSVGKAHSLALTKTGEVYSWGKDQEYNGCLGLGSFLDVLEMEGVRNEYDGFVVDQPIRIELGRKVYGVFAGDDVSVFLM